MRSSILLAMALLLSAAPLHAATVDMSGTVGTVYLHPTGMAGNRATDPSLDWDLGPNVWWKNNWSAFEAAKTRDLALIKSNLGDHPRALLIVYFPLYLADASYGDTYLQRLDAVVSFFSASSLRVMLLLGRPELTASGTWVDAHDPVADSTARAYLLDNMGRTLRFGSIPANVKLVSVYYLGESYVCPKSEADILAYNKDLKQTINAAGMQFIHHVDGPFWENQNIDGHNTWNQCGYTPASIAASSGASDGLVAESWTQGSLVPGVQRLLSEGRFTKEQMLLMIDVPNCDDPAVTKTCATGSLATDISTWFGWIDDLGMRSWAAWSYADGALADKNEYGDAKNDGSALTPKGELLRAMALQWKARLGDVNGDGSVTAADIFYLISHLYAGGPPPAPAGFPDVNNDGQTTASDVFYLINYVFAGGPAPV